MSHPLRIGVLLAGPVQLLDASPIDLFSMLSKPYLQSCRLPSPLIALGLDVSIHYINDAVGPGESVLCTANAGLQVTAGIEDEAVAPGKLDILMVPGPDPGFVPPESVLEFVRGHNEVGTVVMSVCTGIFVVGMAGILDGKKATGPRGLLGGLKGKFPGVEWEDRRWTSDGNVWTSGGITNGLDMTAAYIKQKWPGPVSDIVLAMADVGDRPAEYDVGRRTETLWFVWKFLAAFRSSLFVRSSEKKTL